MLDVTVYIQPLVGCISKLRFAVLCRALWITLDSTASLPVELNFTEGLGLVTLHKMLCWGKIGKKNSTLTFWKNHQNPGYKSWKIYYVTTEVLRKLWCICENFVFRLYLLLQKCCLFWRGFIQSVDCYYLLSLGKFGPVFWHLLCSWCSCVKCSTCEHM